MGRGVSSGGGQSSLDYLFGSGEAPKPKAAPVSTSNVEASPRKLQVARNEPPPKPTAVSPPAAEALKQIPAGIHGNKANNYLGTELGDLKDYGSAAIRLDEVPHTAVGHHFPQHTDFMVKLPNEKKFHLGLQVCSTYDCWSPLSSAPFLSCNSTLVSLEKQIELG